MAGALRQMPARIHPFMQNPHHDNLFINDAIVNMVRVHVQPVVYPGTGFSPDKHFIPGKRKLRSL